jgi:hypothetical protein
LRSHCHKELEQKKWVVFVDSSRRYVDFTDEVCDLLGYSRSELLQKTIDDISYNVEAVPKLFADFVDSGTQQGDFLLQSKACKPVPIHYQAFAFPDGCKAAVWEPIRDWRETYVEALLELDVRKQKQKLELAAAAIDLARRELPPNTPGSERLRLRDALTAVQALLREIK